MSSTGGDGIELSSNAQDTIWTDVVVFNAANNGIQNAVPYNNAVFQRVVVGNSGRGFANVTSATLATVMSSGDALASVMSPFFLAGVTSATGSSNGIYNRSWASNVASIAHEDTGLNSSEAGVLPFFSDLALLYNDVNGTGSFDVQEGDDLHLQRPVAGHRQHEYERDLVLRRKLQRVPDRPRRGWPGTR